MRTTGICTALALVFLLAPSADAADWLVKAKLTCHVSENGGTKLGKVTTQDQWLIGACLDVEPTDPVIANFSLAYDSGLQRLRVLRNCDSEVICSLTAAAVCATATNGTETNFKVKRQCVQGFVDLAGATLEGSVIGKESTSVKTESDKLTFKTSCDGNLEFDGNPCELTFSSGKLFAESGTCPT